MEAKKGKKKVEEEESVNCETHAKIDKDSLEHLVGI